MTPDEAIDVIARAVIADVVTDHLDDEAWANRPAIGEHDWGWVVDRIGELVNDYDDEDYDTAYALLTARATAGPA